MGKNIGNIKYTKKLASDFAKSLKKGDVVFLYGELGAGKTAFIKYVMESLGYKGNVVSPTFVLERRYKTNNFIVYHLDLYRIKTVDLSLLEFLNDKDKNGVYFIEWPEIIEGIIIPNYKIYIKVVSENLRDIKIN